MCNIGKCQRPKRRNEIFCCFTCRTSEGLKHGKKCNEDNRSRVQDERKTTHDKAKGSRDHKCGKGCGRNKTGRHQTCCIACSRTDGTMGVHDAGCDSRVPGDKHLAKKAMKMVKLGNKYGVGPADMVFPDMAHCTVPQNLDEIWELAWTLCLMSMSEVAQGQHVTFVTGGWGTGVYKNPVDRVVRALLTVLEKHGDGFTVVFCHYKKANKTVDQLVNSAYKSQLITPSTITTCVGDMVDVAAEQSANGGLVFLHNFANGVQAGGGAVNGRNAQEENLLRRVTNALPSLLKLRPFYLPGELPADWMGQSILATAVTPNCWISGDEVGRHTPFYVLSVAAPNMTNNAWSAFF